MRGTRLLVLESKIYINRPTNKYLFLGHISMTLTLLILEDLLLNRSKSNSRELLMIDPGKCLRAVHLNVSVPQYRIVGHFKDEIPTKKEYENIFIDKIYIF